MSLEEYLQFSPEFFIEEQRGEASRTYRALLEEISSLDSVKDDLFISLRGLFAAEIRFSFSLAHTPTLEEIEDVSEFNLGELSYRAHRHLYRLLRPEQYEPRMYTTAPQKFQVGHRFAIALCEHASKHSVDDVELFNDATGGGGGDGAPLFWTTAPYLHDELMRQGISSEKAIEHIYLWAVNAGRRLAIDEHYSNAYDFVPQQPHLLQRFSESYRLGYSDKMPSHLHARICAKRLLTLVGDNH